MRAGATAIFLLLWLAGLPALRGGTASVWAQDAPRLVSYAVATDSFSEKAAAVINHLARDNFERAKEFQLVDVRGFLLEGADDPRLDTYNQALRLLERGKSQYDNLELDPALDDLTRAVETFEKAAGRLGDGEKYMETLLYLGASYILSGDNERGRSAFRRVAMYDKRRNLDPKVFPPSMIEIFNNVKQEVAAGPVGTVMVKSTPKAAEVYLNAVYKGITPVSLVKVPEGTHFVRVEKDGYLPWGQRVEFFATHEETVEATLAAAPRHGELMSWRKKLLTDDLEDERPKPDIVQFGEWLRGDRLALMLVKQRGDEIEVQAAMIQLQPPRRITYREGTFNLTARNFLARADAFVTSLYRDVKLPPPEGASQKTQSVVMNARCNSDSDCSTGEICDTASGRCIPYAPEGDKVYEKWWFWAIVGGGLAVAGGTTFLVWYLMQPEEGAIEFTF